MSDDTNPTPAEIEATGIDTVNVEHKGITYVLPAKYNDAPMEIIEQLEEDNLTLALRALLGDEQWATFKASKPTIGDRSVLFNAWYAAIGLRTAGD